MDRTEIGRNRVDWVNLALDRDKRWAVMNAVTNLKVL